MAKHTIMLGRGLDSATDIGYRRLNIEDDQKIQTGMNPNYKEISIVDIDFDDEYHFYISEDDALALSFKLFDIVEARKKERGET